MMDRKVFRHIAARRRPADINLFVTTLKTQLSKYSFVVAVDALAVDGLDRIAGYTFPHFCLPSRRLPKNKRHSFS